MKAYLGRWSFAWIVGVVGVVSACSSSSSSSGSLPFAAQDQIYFGSGGVYEVKILDYSGACSLEQEDDSHKAGSQYIELDYAGSSAPTVGTYELGGPLTISLHQRDASCNLTEFDATSGSVTITSETGTQLTGTFTADIPTFGMVGGEIDAAFCDLSTSTGSSTCVE